MPVGPRQGLSSRGKWAVKLIVAGAFVVLGVAGCSNDQDKTAGTAPLERLLIMSGPDGFRREDATGRLDAGEAAASFGVASGEIRRRLERTGFQAGYARVWSKGDAFAVVAVYDFLNADRAAELTSEVVASYRSLEAAQHVELPELAAAGVLVNARRGDDTLFCQLVLFSRAARAFLVRTCDTSPASMTTVTSLAERQQQRADG